MIRMVHGRSRDLLPHILFIKDNMNPCIIKECREEIDRLKVISLNYEAQNEILKSRIHNLLGDLEEAREHIAILTIEKSTLSNNE